MNVGDCISNLRRPNQLGYLSMFVLRVICYNQNSSVKGLGSQQKSPLILQTRLLWPEEVAWCAQVLSLLVHMSLVKPQFTPFYYSLHPN